MGADLDRDAPVREGDILAGRYRVERVLAVGGMGMVVAARHMTLNQRVAVKVLTHNAGSSQATARFLTEAKASALLRSDHVVRVSDVGTLDNGLPFMVMELLEGQDLSQVLETEGSQSVEQAVDMVLQACEGLAEAHAARIVHRDLKPGNLFRARTPDGSDVIKVLDFGVSKALSQDVRAEGTVTTTDAVFGSPLYMSPEQMQSASKADERSDIWSLGVVLYELVTGKMPFDAESMAGLAVRIATDPPTRMVKALPTTPPALEAVVFKCLEKKPDDRYPNIAELAADLEPFAPGSRTRVERIQRLVFGMTNPPRPVPSAPSLRRVALGAETLGPLDTGGSLPRIQIPDRSRRTLPIALGVGVAFGIALAAAMFVRADDHAVHDTPVVSAVPQIATNAVAAAPTQAATVESATPEPAAIASTSASAAHATRPHHHTQSPAHVATATSTVVLTGISRDRK
ncbi:MAG TPA: serine/threonine-protein kinase [Polyangiaceae bacterium]|jgi:serine/threonine-protein kinase